MTTFVALCCHFMGLSPRGRPLAGGFRHETQASVERLGNQAESQLDPAATGGREVAPRAQGTCLLLPPCGSSSMAASHSPRQCLPTQSRVSSPRAKDMCWVAHGLDSKLCAPLNRPKLLECGPAQENMDHMASFPPWGWGHWKVREGRPYT